VILPFFYGWIIVGIAMLAGFLGSGVSNVTMVVALKPITEDLDWSRTLTSSAISIGSVAGGLWRLWWGRSRIGWDRAFSFPLALHSSAHSSCA
jgi:hypothetical protein